MTPACGDRAPRGERCTVTEQALYATTQAIERELGDVGWAVYRLGDDVQRELVDVAFDLATLSVDRVSGRTSRWAAEIQEGARTLASAARIELTLRQTQNNFEVYTLVKNVRTRVGFDADVVDLDRLVAQAYTLGAYADLWAIEGLGHDYTNLRLDRGHAEGILCDGPAAALPASSLTMMHAGLGLALAERMLPRLTPCACRREFTTLLAEYITACDAHGREGYRGCAYESLGLVARTWHPQLVAGIDAALVRMDERIAGHFWHGAGRALYFLPAYIVPVLSPWAAADREAPHQLARRNLYAGLAWAWTLVNIRHPRILAELLRMRGGQLLRDDAFANGVASALVVGFDVTPDDPYIQAFTRYVPEEADAADAWEAVIAPAARAALTSYHPVLRSRGVLETVFRYADIDGEVRRVPRGEPPQAAPPIAATPTPPVVRPADPRPGFYPSSTV